MKKGFIWIWLIILTFGFLAFAALVIWVTPWIYSTFHPYPAGVPAAEVGGKMSELGTFGDSAGFWNALFSALAFGGVIFTIFYQSNKDRKDEERAMLAQFQEQCMSLLGMLTEVVAQLRISQQPETVNQFVASGDISSLWNSNSPEVRKPSKTSDYDRNNDITGRACFKYIFEELPGERSIAGYITKYYNSHTDAEPDEDLYTSLKDVAGSHFDHYFRLVYRILLFIKDSDLGDIDLKKQQERRDLCANLLRAQLSTYELLMLYYNGLCPKFRETSKKLYQHFCIFDNLDPYALVHVSEQNYYRYVCDHRRNGDAFDDTKHYDCSAFTKPKKTAAPRKKNWFKKQILRVRIWGRGFFRRQNTTTEESGVDQICLEIFNVLKNHQGEKLTYKKLKTLCGIRSENILKEKISLLESGGYIKVENTNQGKKYRVLKTYGS